MPPLRTTDRTRPRQDPVSCQLCRSKKLKCDRLRPCSNCNSRGVRCEYHGEQSYSAPTEPVSHDEDLRAENVAIRVRLQLLEKAVFGSKSPTSVPISNGSSPAPSQHTAIQDVASNEKPPSDKHWLEVMDLAQLHELPEYSESFQIHLHSMEQMCAYQNEMSAKRPISLPTQEIAMMLFDIYSDKLESVQHIMHIPTVRQMFHSIYSNINAGQPIHPGNLALLLSVCAHASIHWTGEHVPAKPFPNEQTAARIEHMWIKEALKAIDEVRLSSTPTLETVQASILAVFFLYHTEGFSSRSRILQGAIVSMARELGMHKVDAPGARPPFKNQADVIRREIERKVWWHLTCTDWFLAFHGSPFEGVYALNPRHMRVQVPRNLNHDDLSTQGPEFSRSLNEPTVMSYYLQRIKMAAVCREAIDELWDGPVYQPERVAYDSVILLDSKFEALLDELPPFMRLDQPVSQLIKDYKAFDMPSLLLHRVVLNMMLNANRAKLHLPYLIRYKSDDRYAYSRLKGLKAVHTIFAIRGGLGEQHDPLFASHLRNGGFSQHFFFAAMVLVLDLSLNDPDNAERKADIRKALSVMEEATKSSRIAHQFLDMLTDLVRKYQIKLPNASAQHQNHGTQVASAKTSQPIAASMPSMPATSNVDAGSDENFDFSLDSSMQFDNFWQDFIQQGPVLDYQDWDALMSDLEARIL